MLADAVRAISALGACAGSALALNLNVPANARCRPSYDVVIVIREANVRGRHGLPSCTDAACRGERFSLPELAQLREPGLLGLPRKCSRPERLKEAFPRYSDQ